MIIGFLACNMLYHKQRDTFLLASNHYHSLLIKLSLKQHNKIKLMLVLFYTFRDFFSAVRVV